MGHQAWATIEGDLHRGLMQYAIRRVLKNPDGRSGAVVNKLRSGVYPGRYGAFWWFCKCNNPQSHHVTVLEIICTQTWSRLKWHQLLVMCGARSSDPNMAKLKAMIKALLKENPDCLRRRASSRSNASGTTPKTRSPRIAKSAKKSGTTKQPDQDDIMHAKTLMLGEGIMANYLPGHFNFLKTFWGTIILGKCYYSRNPKILPHDPNSRLLAPHNGSVVVSVCDEPQVHRQILMMRLRRDLVRILLRKKLPQMMNALVLWLGQCFFWGGQFDKTKFDTLTQRLTKSLVVGCKCHQMPWKSEATQKLANIHLMLTRRKPRPGAMCMVGGLILYLKLGCSSQKMVR